MKLLSSSGRKKRGTSRVNHSVLLFRGKVYEWGSSEYPWPNLGRNPSSCDIQWNWTPKSWSKCITRDTKQWSDNYKGTYGEYKVISNNCHHYAKRLAAKLFGDCGR